MNGENLSSGPTCAEEQELQKKINYKKGQPVHVGYRQGRAE